MDERICKSCVHFYQHYVLDQRRIFRVQCGHCSFKRGKSGKPTAAACEAYAPAPPDEDAFASKEYLSKVLLQYMLDLELLPQIEDAAECGFK